MVLLVNEFSTGKKTKGLAVTYRAGVNDKFGTCPADCKLNPSGRGCGMKAIDYEYLDAIYNSVPAGGFAFTFSHFNPIFGLRIYCPAINTQRSITARMFGKMFYISLKNARSPQF